MRGCAEPQSALGRPTGTTHPPTFTHTHIFKHTAPSLHPHPVTKCDPPVAVAPALLATLNETKSFCAFVRDMRREFRSLALAGAAAAAPAPPAATGGQPPAAGEPATGPQAQQ